MAHAKAAYRPSVIATGNVGYNYIDEVYDPIRTRGSTRPGGGGLTVSQNLFNGNRSVNGVRQAESQVLQSREQMRNTEQSVLQNGATAYMNVLRDAAILDLDRDNILVLEEQLRHTQDRLRVGDVTATDLAQSEASLSSARTNYFAARSNLATSVWTYRQVIGLNPDHLEAARPIDGLLPATLNDAINVAITSHPVIQAAFHNVDAAQLQVQLNEGQLYPTLNLVGNVQENNAYAGLPGNRLFNASLLGQVAMPIYTGGDTFASIRQAKELLAQARLQADLQRDIVRTAVGSTWGQLRAARSAIRSAQATVKASESALGGVRAEAKAGQRTTLDVLNAQQAQLQSRITLVSTQRDRVVASYAVMAAIGQLSAANLGLSAIRYDPTIHFAQVKDKWVGLRTPTAVDRLAASHDRPPDALSGRVIRTLG